MREGGVRVKARESCIQLFKTILELVKQISHRTRRFSSGFRTALLEELHITTMQPLSHLTIRRHPSCTAPISTAPPPRRRDLVEAAHLEEMPQARVIPQTQRAFNIQNTIREAPTQACAPPSSTTRIRTLTELSAETQ